jgi:hypothetical protein
VGGGEKVSRNLFDVYCTVLGLDVSYCGNEVRVMGKNGNPGRRYSAEQKAAAVRILRTLRAELGTNRGPAQPVALQFGYGIK